MLPMKFYINDRIINLKLLLHEMSNIVVCRNNIVNKKDKRSINQGFYIRFRCCSERSLLYGKSIPIDAPER